MIVFIKKILLPLLLNIFLQSCSTALTIVDTTTSVAINTVKKVMYITTCPFTKKECF